MRKFEHSHTNLLKLFSQGGLSVGDIRKHLREFWFADFSDEFSRPSTPAVDRSTTLKCGGETARLSFLWASL